MRYIMTRQSVDLTDVNNDWLLGLITSGEYRSKNEAINDVLNRARRKEQLIENIRHELIESEKSGFTTQTLEEIRAEAKRELKSDV